jgi:hypothetical protein
MSVKMLQMVMDAWCKQLPGGWYLWGQNDQSQTEDKTLHTFFAPHQVIEEALRSLLGTQLMLGVLLAMLLLVLYRLFPMGRTFSHHCGTSRALCIVPLLKSTQDLFA